MYKSHLFLTGKPHILLRHQSPGAMYRKLASIFSAQAQQSCAAECEEPCFPADPGSVTPHTHHVLVRLGPREAWVENVDTSPLIAGINGALSQHKATINGKIKVTAFDYISGHEIFSNQDKEVLILGKSTNAWLTNVDGGDDAVASTVLSNLGVPLDERTSHKLRSIPKYVLLVCCHMGRDVRCGRRGSALAENLVRAAEKLKIAENDIQVLASSHIGGHKYAANIAVYGRNRSSGHWFGGLSPADAEDFLAALNSLGDEEEALGSKTLRKWWRGCIGLGKDEQIDTFNRMKDIEDL